MKKLISVFLSLMLVLALPVQVLAETYDLTKGSINVSATDSGQYVYQVGNPDTQPQPGKRDEKPVITSYGKSTANDVFIQSSRDSGATVTLENVHISTSDKAGVQVNGNGNTINLKGNNTVTSSDENSAMVVGGNLTISGDSDASLSVNKSTVNSGCSVTVTGGTVNGVEYQTPAPEPEPEPEPEPAPAPAVWAEKVKSPEPSYWDSLIWKLSQMEDDITLTLDLGAYTWIPRTLIQTARGKNITLILQWNGGEDITILPTDTIDLSLWSIQLKDLA